MYEIFYNAIIFQDIIRVFSYDNFFPKEYLTLRETILSICKLKRVLVTSFVCLFVCLFSSHSRIFHSHGDFTITGKRTANFYLYSAYWAVRVLQSVTTGHPFIMVISEDPVAERLAVELLLPVTTYFNRLRSVKARTFHVQSERSNQLRHDRSCNKV